MEYFIAVLILLGLFAMILPLFLLGKSLLARVGNHLVDSYYAKPGRSIYPKKETDI